MEHTNRIVEEFKKFRILADEFNERLQAQKNANKAADEALARLRPTLQILIGSRGVGKTTVARKMLAPVVSVTEDIYTRTLADFKFYHQLFDPSCMPSADAIANLDENDGMIRAALYHTYMNTDREHMLDKFCKKVQVIGRANFVPTFTVFVDDCNDLADFTTIVNKCSDTFVIKILHVICQQPPGVGRDYIAEGVSHKMPDVNAILDAAIQAEIAIATMDLNAPPAVHY